MAGILTIEGKNTVANILLVEDDPLVTEALSSAIEFQGHTVVAAANGCEGLKQYAQGRFDLVITDIIMPDMEGIGMIIEMRKKAPDAKIVAISGGGRIGTTDFLEAAQKFGAMAIMQKPIRLAEFFRILADCLGENSGSPQTIARIAV